MTKLQEVRRKNGTVVMNLFLPVDVVRESGLLKGDVVSVVVESPGVLRVVKR